jgi:alpha-L-fucosidase
MYRSTVDPFNIYDATPFKRDSLKELAVACQRAGIKFGFYYSQAQDWIAQGGSSYDPRWG